MDPSEVFGSELSSSKPNAFSLRKILFCFVFFFLCPVSPAILVYINKKRERQLKLNHKTLSSLDPMDKTNIEDRLKHFKQRNKIIEDQKRIERLLMTSYKIENVLENAPQLLIQFLIILMGASLIKLPQLSGIEAVFDNHVSGNTLSSTFYYFSVALSLFSVCSGLFGTFMMQKQYNVPDLGKVLKLLSIFVGSFARILAIVLYFAPFLGIFNLMLPYSIENTIKYNSNVKNIIGKEILDKMSDITFYTAGVDKGTAFVIFTVQRTSS